MTALFAPLTLRGVTFDNRIWVSPMCMYACEGEPGVVGDWHIAHYGQFALGGAGLIVTEATAVVPEGRVTPQDAGLWNDSQVAPWRRVTDVVHAAGSRIAVQLGHAGRKGGKYRGLPGDEFRNTSVPLDSGGWQTTGATGQPFGRYDAPRPATPGTLDEIVRAYADAARRAHEAGFDVIEIHAAHGYLLHELLSPLTHAPDEFDGRDIGAREKALFDTVDAVRSAWPAEKPLFVRLSVSDAAMGGTTAEDTADLARRLKNHGVDLIDCSSGGLLAGSDYSPYPGYQVAGSAHVRSAGQIPTSAVGLITSPIQAEAIVASGQADAVMLGREMLRDPHWARSAARELDHSGTSPNPRYHRAYL